MQTVKQAIIFDGDDTLWATQILYEDAKEQFWNLMESIGMGREVARQKLAETDVANVAKMGFSKHRFPRSMIEVYEQYCIENSLTPDPVVIKTIRGLGYSPYDRTPALADDVTQTLAQLRHRYHLFLYTGGDPEVQTKKLRNLGLTEAFDAVYIFQKKTDAQLAQILAEQHLSPGTTWMVGNSLKSDINPALRLKMRAIWIQGETWEYDTEPLASGTVYQVTKLSEIPGLLESVNNTIIM